MESEKKMVNSEKIKFKLCVLGDPSVGKTSLIHHFCEGFFKESYLSTIGVTFLTKNMDMNYDGRNLDVVLQIWDVGGQSIFSRIRQNYLKGSQGAFILFDVTNKNTLMHVDSWIEELLRALGVQNLEKIPILVIGNKIDLDFDESLKNRAKKYLENQFQSRVPITYTSAKTGLGMKESFKKITRMMLEKVEEA